MRDRFTIFMSMATNSRTNRYANVFAGTLLMPATGRADEVFSEDSPGNTERRRIWLTGRASAPAHARWSTARS